MPTFRDPLASDEGLLLLHHRRRMRVVVQARRAFVVHRKPLEDVPCTKADRARVANAMKRPLVVL